MENSESIYIAIIDGNLELLKNLIHSGVKYDHNAMRYAIFNENFEIVKYLFEIGATTWTNTIPESFSRKYDRFGNQYGPQEKFRKIMKYLIPRVKFINFYNDCDYTDKINELISEIVLEIEPIVSEYIGTDISSIILSYYKPDQDLKYARHEKRLLSFGEDYWLNYNVPNYSN